MKKKVSISKKMNDKLVKFDDAIRWGVRNNHPFSLWPSRVAAQTGLSYDTAFRQLREYLYHTGPNGYRFVLKAPKKDSKPKKPKA